MVKVTHVCRITLEDTAPDTRPARFFSWKISSEPIYNTSFSKINLIDEHHLLDFQSVDAITRSKELLRQRSVLRPKKKFSVMPFRSPILPLVRTF